VGVADPDLDLIGEAGPFDVIAGDSGMMLIYLQGDQGSVVGKGTGKVDGTVASQGAYLQNAPRPGYLGEQLQQPSLLRGSRPMG
jgi:hypothetical protein